MAKEKTIHLISTYTNNFENFKTLTLEQINIILDSMSSLTAAEIIEISQIKSTADQFFGDWLCDKLKSSPNKPENSPELKKMLITLDRLLIQKVKSPDFLDFIKVAPEFSLRLCAYEPLMITYIQPKMFKEILKLNKNEIIESLLKFTKFREMIKGMIAELIHDAAQKKSEKIIKQPSEMTPNDIRMRELDSRFEALLANAPTNLLPIEEIPQNEVVNTKFMSIPRDQFETILDLMHKINFNQLLELAELKDGTPQRFDEAIQVIASLNEKILDKTINLLFKLIKPENFIECLEKSTTFATMMIRKFSLGLENRKYVPDLTTLKRIAEINLDAFFELLNYPWIRAHIQNLEHLKFLIGKSFISTKNEEESNNKYPTDNSENDASGDEEEPDQRTSDIFFEIEAWFSGANKTDNGKEKVASNVNDTWKFVNNTAELMELARLSEGLAYHVLAQTDELFELIDPETLFKLPAGLSHDSLELIKDRRMPNIFINSLEDLINTLDLTPSLFVMALNGLTQRPQANETLSELAKNTFKKIHASQMAISWLKNLEVIRNTIKYDSAELLKNNTANGLIAALPTLPAEVKNFIEELAKNNLLHQLPTLIDLIIYESWYTSRYIHSLEAVEKIAENLQISFSKDTNLTLLNKKSLNRACELIAENNEIAKLIKTPEDLIKIAKKCSYLAFELARNGGIKQIQFNGQQIIDLKKYSHHAASLIKSENEKRKALERMDDAKLSESDSESDIDDFDSYKRNLQNLSLNFTFSIGSLFLYTMKIKRVETLQKLSEFSSFLLNKLYRPTLEIPSRIIDIMREGKELTAALSNGMAINQELNATSLLVKKSKITHSHSNNFNAEVNRKTAVTMESADLNETFNANTLEENFHSTFNRLFVEYNPTLFGLKANKTDSNGLRPAKITAFLAQAYQQIQPSLINVDDSLNLGPHVKIQDQLNYIFKMDAIIKTRVEIIRDLKSAHLSPLTAFEFERAAHVLATLTQMELISVDDKNAYIMKLKTLASVKNFTHSPVDKLTEEMLEKANQPLLPDDWGSLSLPPRPSTFKIPEIIKMEHQERKSIDYH